MVNFAEPIKKTCLFFLSILNTILPILRYNDIPIPNEVIIGANVGSSIILALAVYADELEKKVNDMLESNIKIKKDIDTISSQQVLTARTADYTAVQIEDDKTEPYGTETENQQPKIIKYILTPRIPERAIRK